MSTGLLTTQDEADADRLIARNLRLAVVQNVYDQGFITYDEARECLCAPLSPGNPATFADDSQRLRVNPEGQP
jgi:hypothetical protein